MESSGEMGSRQRPAKFVKYFWIVPIILLGGGALVVYYYLTIIVSQEIEIRGNEYLNGISRNDARAFSIFLNDGERLEIYVIVNGGISDNDKVDLDIFKPNDKTPISMTPTPQGARLSLNIDRDGFHIFRFINNHSGDPIDVSCSWRIITKEDITLKFISEILLVAGAVSLGAGIPLFYTDIVPTIRKFLTKKQ